jgi:uncharacterized membrane protein YqjE
MDQQNFSLMIALFVFLGAPFLLLFIWQTKHASRLPAKLVPLCCLIVCGSAFVAGFLLASVTDSTFYALARAFQLDRETSATSARLVINLMAVLAASLAGLWVVRKITRSAPSLDS